MAGNLEEFEVAPEKDPEYTLQPADEAKYIKENK
jgi:hypothetical protein